MPSGWRKDFKRNIARRAATLLLLAIPFSGCSQLTRDHYPTHGIPTIGPGSSTSTALQQLAPSPRRLTVAVYDFPDLTGQRKPANGVVSDLSTAVTQGASSVVIDSLKLAGNGSLFEVVDRTRDADQARERSILSSRNPRLAPPGARKPEQPAAPPADEGIPPLKPAEYIINGGVIAFERSIVTENQSMSVMGIGGSRSLIRNYISVNMRLVRADTAEVIESVTAYRSVDTDTAGVSSVSRAASGIFPESLLQRYPSPSDYFTGDISGSRSEMTQIALREAIEAALLDLIYRAAPRGVWSSPLPPPMMAKASMSEAAPRPMPPAPRPKAPPKVSMRQDPRQLAQQDVRQSDSRQANPYQPSAPPSAPPSASSNAAPDTTVTNSVTTNNGKPVSARSRTNGNIARSEPVTDPRMPVASAPRTTQPYTQAYADSAASAGETRAVRTRSSQKEQCDDQSSSLFSGKSLLSGC